MISLVSKSKFLYLSLTLLLLSGCATPAHENTVYLGNDIHTITVKVHSLGTYEIYGYLVDNKGLRSQVAELTKSQGLKTMVIVEKTNASILDQAFAVYVGEQNGLSTFKREFFWSKTISSEALLLELTDSNQTFSLESLWNASNDAT